jgi:hypothetical protein
LAKRGWQVTAVDFVDEALDKAKQRAAEQGVEVQWVRGDVAQVGQLGLEPGYTLLYDFGCIHGLSDAQRHSAARGLSDLAAPGAVLLIGAFMAGRRMLLPRGMNQEDVVALLGDSWQLEHAQSEVADEVPRPIRRARPTLYRLARRA